MHDIVFWLIGVEKKAADIYQEAATLFHEDVDFSELLSLMSSEENEHAKLFEEVSAYMSQDEMKHASFYLDEGHRQKIEVPFSRAMNLIDDRALDKTSMLEILVDAEFSEWNEILLYILDRLNVSEEEIQHLLSDIDQHRRHVLEYLDTLQNGDIYLRRIRQQSQASGKHILIVEDNLSVALMLKALILNEGDVIIARDGHEGIMSLRQKHFDLVVSDVELVQMNGIEMYKQALGIDPSLSRKFLFFTGTENKEFLDTIKDLNLVMLPKPSPVKYISQKMIEILNTQPPSHEKN